MQTNYQAATLIGETIELTRRSRTKVCAPGGSGACGSLKRGLASECQALARSRMWEEVVWLALGASALASLALSFM